MRKTTMTRLMALLCVALVIFAACGDDGGDNGGPAASKCPDELTAPSGDDSQGADFSLSEDGHLTVGSDIPYPPFEFNDDDGCLTGFDVELVRAVSDKLGLQNTDDDWLSVNFDTIFTQLQRTPKFDIIAAAVTAYAPEGSPAFQVTEERKTHVDFTVPVYPSLQSLTIDTSATPDITGVDSLPDDARVAVQASTTGAFYAEENLPNVELVQFPKAPGMYQALEAGQVVAVLNDLPVSLDAIDGKPKLEVVEQLDTGEEYAFAVSKDDPALLEAMDTALQELYEDGTYAQIYEKYFPEQELPDYASE